MVGRALQLVQQALLHQRSTMRNSVDHAQGRSNTMIVTHNGGRVAVGTELDHENTTREERDLIVQREERVAAWRKSLPRRKRPEHEKPGPLVWIQP